MDVRSAALDRLGQDGVDQADDRGIILLLHQVLGFGNRFRQAGQVHVLADALNHLHGFFGIVLVGAGQRLIKRVGLHFPDARTATTQPRGLGNGPCRGTGAHQKLQFTLIVRGQHNAIASGKTEGQSGVLGAGLVQGFAHVANRALLVCGYVSIPG